MISSLPHDYFLTSNQPSYRFSNSWTHWHSHISASSVNETYYSLNDWVAIISKHSTILQRVFWLFGVLKTYSLD